MPSIQVERYQLEERQPRPFNSWGGFNNITATSSSQDKAAAGNSAAESSRNGHQSSSADLHPLFNSTDAETMLPVGSTPGKASINALRRQRRGAVPGTTSAGPIVCASAAE